MLMSNTDTNRRREKRCTISNAYATENNNHNNNNNNNNRSCKDMVYNSSFFFFFFGLYFRSISCRSYEALNMKRKYCGLSVMYIYIDIYGCRKQIDLASVSFFLFLSPLSFCYQCLLVIHRRPSLLI